MSHDTTTDLPAFPDWMPPHLALMQLVAAKWISAPLVALAELGIADLLANGPCSVENLADACGADPDPLRRCLRATAAVGVFAELDNGHFTLTPMAEHLRYGRELSLRDLTLFLGAEPTQRSFERITDVLRTGRPGFEDANGKDFFAFLADNPQLGAVYQGAWAPLTAGVARALVEAVDFTAFSTVADLGGGTGTLLRSVLEANEHLQGILMDRPEVIARADPALAGGPLANRTHLVPGVLPSGIPDGADVYMVKNALHCMPEAEVEAALKSIRTVIGDRSDARLLLIEAVLQPGNAYDWGRFVDIEVMINCGGRVHTREEWEELLTSCGFEPADVRTLLPPQWLITARPV
ncbi:acetylserotonin O-methyltransferase [Streptomyces sp. RB6PN25]|uniref:Acetylserotonin O-methyltransferase n=1 Tax=Streptomyces humicola TaxID=2953240 RepID=A0ABT1PUD3_9ACTN|nr:acetylserotonin O-methyltransferase [Streptomyces humicola]MCQ4080753.1 acetylserotonin O-methyltransferase [Streptomyces humicola]